MSAFCSVGVFFLFVLDVSLNVEIRPEQKFRALGSRALDRLCVHAYCRLLCAWRQEFSPENAAEELEHR